MVGDDLAVLRRRLVGAPEPGSHVEDPLCGLCACSLDEATGSRVEVTLRSGDDGSDAWLCEVCYGYVVEELNVAPVRVFKAGPRRSVVLPVATGFGREAGE